MSTSDGRKRKISALQAVVKKMLNKALQGDLKAAKYILDQLNAGTGQSGDNLANLLQELRAQRARYETGDMGPLPADESRR
jgi:hypothetical protein